MQRHSLAERRRHAMLELLALGSDLTTPQIAELLGFKTDAARVLLLELCWEGLVTKSKRNVPKRRTEASQLFSDRTHPWSWSITPKGEARADQLGEVAA